MRVRTLGLAVGLFIFTPLAFGADSNSGDKLSGLTLRASEIPGEVMAKAKKTGMPKKLPTKRGPAAFSAGYRRIKAKCPVYRHPNPMSPRIGSLKKGTRIWLEGVDTEWTRGFRRQKSIFVPADCLK